jgi:NADP-dependent 3-hydroxy acid dehydrogenase YdfG
MGKTVLATGAASGFGHGVAFGLAKRGHKVIASCQIWPQVWELRNAAKADNVEMQVIKLDVLNEIDRAHALGLEIDVLFNIADHMVALGDISRKDVAAVLVASLPDDVARNRLYVIWDGDIPIKQALGSLV